MASPTRSVGTTKTASCGAFNVAFVAYLIAMMVGAAEQHAQIPSTPGTAIGVGFCAAALAFTLSEFALWEQVAAPHTHQPACPPATTYQRLVHSLPHASPYRPHVEPSNASLCISTTPDGIPRYYKQLWACTVPLQALWFPLLPSEHGLRRYAFIFQWLFIFRPELHLPARWKRICA